MILVVDLDKIEIQVECQFEAVGQFHFVITFIPVYFYDRCIRVVLFYIRCNLLWNDSCGNRRIFAVDFFPISVFEEFDFSTVGKYDFVFAVEKFPFEFGVCHFLIGEMLFYKLLRLLGQLVYGNHAVVVGFCGENTQREQDG